jgi:ABC-type transport system involved in cytochrome bd biosynthesis fused ATPase/permease subunit
MLNKVVEYIRRDEWSPYIAGILLGVVGIAAVAISNSLLGASGAFESLVGIIGKAIAPSIFSNTYFNYVVPSEITWAVVLLIGIFLVED